MKLTKKYYIVDRNGEYVTHGETSEGQHIGTTATVEEFDNKEEYLLELGKYTEVDTIELEEI